MTDQPNRGDVVPVVPASVADAMLGLDRLIRRDALIIAANTRREAFHLQRDTGTPYAGEMAREILVDAALYAAWIADGTMPVPPPVLVDQPEQADHA